MKRMTLELTVKPGYVLVLKTLSFIRGDIERVIKILGKTMHRANVLVDMASFRSRAADGKYELISRNGVFLHHQVRDMMNEQSGLIMLCPGDVLTFAFGGQYIHILNTPRVAANAYLRFIVSRSPLKSYLSEQLAAIRNQPLSAIPVGGEEWSPSQGTLTPTN